MESYLINIFRKGKEDQEDLVGIVEKIGTGEKVPFKNISDLCNILTEPKTGNRNTDTEGHITKV